MESYFSTMTGKVRDRYPENPSTEERRRTGERFYASEAKVIYPEVAGVLARDYQALPNEVWNGISSAAGETIKKLVQTFNESFKVGPELELLEHLQETIPQAMAELGREMMGALLSKVTGFYGTYIKCHHKRCKGILEFQGYTQKTLKTTMGPVPFCRAYYSGRCGHSAFPIDALLGVDDEHAVLPLLRDNVAYLAAQMPFQPAVETLQRLTPVGTFSLRLFEEVTKTIALEFSTLQQDELKDVKPGWMEGAELEDKTVVVAVDGGMCKARDHKDRCREFKLAVMGELGAEGEVLNKTYVATFDGADDLFERTSFEYIRKGHDRAQRVHLIADGACWIENRKDELIQPGQELSMVLDWYHATERLKEFADEILRVGSPANQIWYEKAKSALWEGRLTEFFRMLDEHVPPAPPKVKIGPKEFDPAEPLRITQKYFEKRRAILNYKFCRDKGLPVGSGMVEGGIRFVAKDRLDRTGMRWSKVGGDNILQLRCIASSRRWDSFCQMQSESRERRFSARKQAWIEAA